MKKTISLRGFVIPVLTLIAMAVQGQTTVSLHGTAPADAKTVYMYNNMGLRGVPDSIAVTDGKWKYDAQRPLGQSLIVLITDVAQKQQKDEEMVPIMVDTTPTEIDLTKLTVKGSKASEAMNNTLRGLIACMTKQPTDGVDPKNEALKLMRSAVMDNLDSMLPLEYVPMIADALSVGDLQRIFYPGAPYANYPLMEDAKQRLALLSGQSVRSIGKTFTDLTMNDTEGKAHKLSEWCGKGRYVLIDFWASWCGPCRAEMPNVVACYEKYHDKGFDIIGISFDNKKEAWLRSISDLKMPWIHLSDLAGWQSIGSSTYDIKSIPSNILLDGEGKIIDVDLRGNILGQRLEEIFNR